MNKERVLTGIRPTGLLHLGNYFGATRNFLRMQDDYDCFVFVADWHSLTTHPDTSELQNGVRRVLAENIACGLDPEKMTLYIQSDVPEIAELYLYLNMLAYKGELEKTTTFKEKVRQHPDNVNAGLLTYPVLQAADIVIHRAAKVPVGKDQEQHLEMARNFAQRFNYRYGHGETILPEPQAFSFEGGDLVKILSLNGEGKMSKSENEMNTLYLADSDDMIRKKIMKAKTDQGPEIPNAPKPDYIQNLFTMMSLVSSPDTLSFFEEQYGLSSAGNCIIRYGDLKKQLAADMVAFLAPIRQRAEEILADRAYLSGIMRTGREKARASADETLQLVRKAIGVCYY
ncbi:MAG TPA: tryptophan--tRNA ligase [Phnomibacter sp.]|nr:tryptophan--tRNA ligase [Phnomibacter sp.]